MTAAAGVLASIWRGLRRVLLRLGRWFAEVLLEEGRRGLAVYVRQRIKVFRRRYARARSVARRDWLAGRIRRWASAAKWLEGDDARRVTKSVARKAAARAAEEIPEEVTGESFDRWRRARRAKRRRHRGGARGR